MLANVDTGVHEAAQPMSWSCPSPHHKAESTRQYVAARADDFLWIAQGWIHTVAALFSAK
jgi:hypothetical protein